MSINANAGERIKISPATSGVSALPPTVSLFYQITESLTAVDPGPSESVSPGTGWSGNTPENGSGEKAIARWTTPPLQVIEDSMNVGVAAFHMNEIEKVEIAADGGDWVEITDPTLNSDSGVFEYHASVGVSAFGNGYGPTELRARVTPNNGIQRVLSLPMVVGTRAALQNATKPAQYTTVYVDSDPVNGGNNSNAGTEAAPWLTLTKAVRGGSYDGDGSGDSSGRIVYLKAGTYVYEDNANGNYGVNPDAWITITPAPGVSRSAVRVIKPSEGVPRMDVENIHWKGIDFVGADDSPYFDATINGSSKTGESAPQDDDSIFLEDCTLGTADKNDPKSIFNTNSTFKNGAYCVNVTGTAYSKPFLGLALARDCTAADVAEDTFTNTKAVINCVLEDSQLPPGSTGHPDVYQIVADGVTETRVNTIENNLVYGLQCYKTDAPILFTSNLDLLKDCAFVNIYSETLGRTSQFRDCSLQHVLVLNYHQNVDAADSGGEGNNFLMEEESFVKDFGAGDVTVYNNFNSVRIENCSFWISNIIQGTYEANHPNAGDPIDIVTDNCSNAKPGESGFSVVEYTSRGWNDDFADTATGSKNVPCDIFNRARSTSGLAVADRGAFEGDPSGYFPASSDVGSSFNPLEDTWETYATLQSELNAVADGDTLDLTGRGFAPTELSQNGDGFELDPEKSITIKGAFFSGAVYGNSAYDWTETTNGVWEAPISNEISLSIKDGKGNRHLVDWKSPVEVNAQQFPDFPLNYPTKEFDHSANSSFLNHDRSNGDFLLDTITTNVDDKIESFRIVDGPTIAALEDYLTDTSFGKNILWKMTPNVSGSTLISGISQDAGPGTPITLAFEEPIGGDYTNPETLNRTASVQVIDGQNKYLISGRPTYKDDGSGSVNQRFELIKGNTYVIDWSNIPDHPLKFATAADAAGETEYTEGVIFNPDDKTTTITVDYNAPRLYYYCENHAGMGEYCTIKDPSNDYVGFAFHGADADRLAAGEFCIDATYDKVRYRPVTAGRPDYAGIASLTQCVDARTGPETTSTFVNCTFSNTAPGNTNGQIFTTGNQGQLVVRNCRFDHGKEAVRGNGKFYYCDFYRFSERVLGSGGAGLVVEDSSFRAGGATNSAILTQGIQPGEDKRIKIQRNYFSISKSTHGQAISLYKDSWQNALVKDNIFHNCKVALTYQHNTNGDKSTIVGAGYALAVENNLFYVDDVYTPDDYVNLNSLAQVVEQMTTTHLDALDPNPQVRFRHNTLMYATDIPSKTDKVPAEGYDRWRLGGMMHADGFQDCDVFYESQITGYRTTGDSDGGSTRNFRSNMIFESRGNGGQAAYVSVEDWWMDYTRPDYYTITDYLNFDTLRPTQALKDQGCIAVDDGDIGARFTGLTADDLSTLQAGWADTFTPVSVPDFDEAEFTQGIGDDGRATNWPYYTKYDDQAVLDSLGNGTKVQFLDTDPNPSPPSPPDFEASGTLDTADGTNGWRDTSPTQTPDEGVTAVTIRGSDTGTNAKFIFRFIGDDSARTAFAAAYPDGSTLSFTTGGVTYTAEGYQWTQGTEFLYLTSSEFDTYPSSIAQDDAYAVQIFTQ